MIIQYNAISEIKMLMCKLYLGAVLIFKVANKYIKANNVQHIE
jgi:hypothetical protein